MMDGHTANQKIITKNKNKNSAAREMKRKMDGTHYEAKSVQTGREEEHPLKCIFFSNKKYSVYFEKQD